MVHVTREASGIFRGPRLQKLRFLSVFFDMLGDKESSFRLYGALEHGDDTYIRFASETECSQIFEQDKNYDDETSFTFNSKEVKNSLCAFLDIWIDCRKDLKCYFTFYSTNGCAKEKITAKLSELSISELPSKSILEILQSQDLVSHLNAVYAGKSLLDIIKIILIDKYETIYSVDAHHGKGYLDEIKTWSNEVWLNFLGQINRMTGKDDEEKLNIVLLDKIKKSPYFSYKLEGLEQEILNDLLDKVDKNLSKKSYVDKFLYCSDIKLVFKEKEARNMNNKKVDLLFGERLNLGEVKDKRTIKEKILSKSNNFSQKMLDVLVIKTTNSKINQRNFTDVRHLQSLQYRIYILCKEILLELIPENELENTQLTNDELDKIIKDLRSKVLDGIKDLMKDFDYGTESMIVIEGIMYDLFDRCFLSFDNA